MKVITQEPPPLISPAKPEQKAESPSPSTNRPTRNLAAWLGFAAVFLVAAVTAFFVLRHTTKLAPARAVLVVLPFVNLSGDAQQDYFADGMTEEMITQLGNLDPEHLGVIARTASMQYKQTKKRASQIAQELGVNYLLEGSVRRDGDHVRVTAQLIRANDETHLWRAISIRNCAKFCDCRVKWRWLFPIKCN